MKYEPETLSVIAKRSMEKPYVIFHMGIPETFFDFLARGYRETLSRLFERERLCIGATWRQELPTARAL